MAHFSAETPEMSVHTASKPLPKKEAESSQVVDCFKFTGGRNRLEVLAV